MNESYILAMVREQAELNTLSYEAFANLFGFLDIAIQESIKDMLIRNGIELVEDYAMTNEDDITSSESDFSEDLNDCNSRMTYVAADAKKPVDKSMSNEQLVFLAQHGNKAASELLCIKNEGLVNKAVSEYAKKYGNDLEDDDLRQEGMMGLLHAITRFDFNFGTKFSTYALIWIRQRINRAIIEQGFTVRIPVHFVDKFHKVNRIDRQLISEGVNTYNDRIELIASELHISAEEAEFAMEKARIFTRLGSLDMPVGEDGDSTLGDFIAADNSADPVEAVLVADSIDIINNALDRFSAREKQVIEMRFGLNNNIPHTLEEIGEEMGVTRERIRQIQEKVLRKLVNNKELQELAA